MDPLPITTLSTPPAGHAKAAGYAIAIASSSKRKGRTIKILICKKGGSYHSEVDEPCRKRQRPTWKTNCPFGFKAWERTDGTWDICFLQVEDGSIDTESISHKHEPAEPSSFPEHRRLNEDVMAMILNNFSMFIPASRTVATLKNREHAP
ncbi:hypothetical protein K3495_g1460 [Podosphaera aphanis]|nr:hypothetical protein K3495_g1460 [Podosphaera aphanis]